jgi:hypothetical protein
MATPAGIEQLEDKDYPAGASLGASQRADTIVTAHADGVSYFGAIATVLDPNRLVGSEPDIGERLLTLADLDAAWDYRLRIRDHLGQVASILPVTSVPES